MGHRRAESASQSTWTFPGGRVTGTAAGDSTPPEAGDGRPRRPPAERDRAGTWSVARQRRGHPRGSGHTRMIVVDASIAAKWYLNEPGSAQAAAILTSDDVLLAPALIRLEVNGAIIRRYREGKLSLE